MLSKIKSEPVEEDEIICVLCKDVLSSNARFHYSIHFFNENAFIKIMQPYDMKDGKAQDIIGNVQKYICPYGPCTRRKMGYKELCVHVATSHQILRHFMGEDKRPGMREALNALYPPWAPSPPKDLIPAVKVKQEKGVTPSNSDDENNAGAEKSQLDDLTLAEVAQRIEDMDANESLMKTKTKVAQKEELEKLETEYKRKRDATLVKHYFENKKICSENEKTKKALHQELERRLASSAGGATGPSTQPPPPSSSSLLPSCPVCYKTMKPPLQIFTCGNGHLICSSCKPEVTMCSCQALFMGRATAMEQMVRMILNID